jgi:hypothetical protein
MEYWTSKEVGLWLRSFSYDSFADTFEKENITGSFLLAHYSNADVMSDLGVTKKLHLARISFEISKLVPFNDSLLENSGHSSELQVRNDSSVSLESTIKTKRKDVSACSSISAAGDGSSSEINSNGTSIGQALSKAKRIKQIIQESNHLQENGSTGEVSLSVEPTQSENETNRFPCFAVEWAVHCRSKCRTCLQPILKGSPKIGLPIFYRQGAVIYPSMSWYHPLCGLSLSHCILEENELGLSIPSSASFSSTEIETKAQLKKKRNVRAKQCKLCKRSVLLVGKEMVPSINLTSAAVSNLNDSNGLSTSKYFEKGSSTTSCPSSSTPPEDYIPVFLLGNINFLAKQQILCINCMQGFCLSMPPNISVECSPVYAKEKGALRQQSEGNTTNMIEQSSARLSLGVACDQILGFSSLTFEQKQLLQKIFL